MPRSAPITRSSSLSEDTKVKQTIPHFIIFNSNFQPFRTLEQVTIISRPPILLCLLQVFSLWKGELADFSSRMEQEIIELEEAILVETFKKVSINRKARDGVRLRQAVLKGRHWAVWKVLKYLLRRQ